MTTTASLTEPRGFARVFSWRRLRFTLGVALLFGLLFSARGEAPLTAWVARAVIVGLVVLLVFGVFAAAATLA
jgi:hypothetical protein